MGEPVREWEIWCEGYRATGESGYASMLGTAMGATFKEACVAFFTSRRDASLYDPKGNTYWACRLFPTYEQARKSYG